MLLFGHGEIIRSKMGIGVSQRKYVLNLLIENCKLGSKLKDTPIESRNKVEENRKPVEKYRYQKMVEKLIYIAYKT